MRRERILEIAIPGYVTAVVGRDGPHRVGLGAEQLRDAHYQRLGGARLGLADHRVAHRPLDRGHQASASRPQDGVEFPVPDLGAGLHDRRALGDRRPARATEPRAPEASAPLLLALRQQEVEGTTGPAIAVPILMDGLAAQPASPRRNDTACRISCAWAISWPRSPRSWSGTGPRSGAKSSGTRTIAAPMKAITRSA